MVSIGPLWAADACRGKCLTVPSKLGKLGFDQVPGRGRGGEGGPVGGLKESRGGEAGRKRAGGGREGRRGGGDSFEDSGVTGLCGPFYFECEDF